ncbi:MAG: hypothetical protein ACKPKO_29685, partial [Candidatus Fonsibacter sp.]
LCNCSPSKIEGYGKYAWTKGSAQRIKNIPKLLDELFEMIKVAPQPTVATTTTNSPRVAPAVPTTGAATTKELQDLKALWSVVASPFPSCTTTQIGFEQA